MSENYAVMEGAREAARRAVGAGVIAPRARVHIPALDGLRGIAVLLVIFYHYCYPLGDADARLSKAVFFLTRFGYLGVDLFFVLSGFLITGILLDSKEKKKYLRNFYVRRSLRIFPLYYAVLAISLVVVPIFWPYTHPDDITAVSHQSALWLHYLNIDTALNGWVMNGQRVNMSHFWTLAVEEQFYLVWPVVVLLVSREGLMKVCVAFIVGALALRVWLVFSSESYLLAYVLTPCRVDALAWGALVAAAARGAGGMEALVKPARWVMAVAGTLLVVIVAKERHVSWGRPLISTFGFSAVAAMSAATVVLVTASTGRDIFSRVCRAWPLRATGRIAYGLYVLHFLIYPWTLGLLPWFSERLPYPLGDAAYVAAAVACAYGLSIASWFLFERHFLAMKGWLAPVEGGMAASRV